MFCLPGVSIREFALEEFWTLHQLSAFKAPSDAKLPHFNVNSFCDALNAICNALPSELDGKRFKFHEYSEGHSPRPKQSRPDIFAFAPIDDDASTPFRQFSWSTTGLVVELCLDPKPLDEGCWRTACHLSSLLKARPDLLVAQGLTILSDTVVFSFAVGGKGITFVRVPLHHDDLDTLCYGFVHRAHVMDEHIADLTINRVYNSDLGNCVFDISLTDEDHTATIARGYSLHTSHSPFGRRTNVFLNRSSPGRLNGKDVPVIKDQYCSQQDADTTEREIFSRLQQQGKIPGVVYAVYCRSVECTISGRSHIRTAMDQLGRTSFLGANTVKEGLCVLYDLLEVTRFIHKNYRVLHHDLSSGNVLITSDAAHYEPNSECDKKRLKGLRYSANILDPTESQWKTKLLLVDFGISEINDQAQPSTFRRSGTPLFMARAVTAGHRLDDDFMFKYPTMPPAPEEYQRVHSDRLSRFPPQAPTPIIEIPPPELSPVAKYELQYDAESVFWLLAFWVVSLQPADAIEAEPFDHHIHLCLHSENHEERQMAHRILTGCGHGRIIHSKFRRLGVLLSYAAQQLMHDTYWIDGSDPRYAAMKDPDYVHEALQRRILAFLVEHSTDEFMHIPLSPQLRTVDDEHGPAYKTSTRKSRGSQDLSDGIDDECRSDDEALGLSPVKQ